MVIKNECIILPGFGGFETYYKPASLDKQAETLMPPSKQIVFRNDYKVDNGILVNYIKIKEKADADEIRKAIDDFVREITTKIDMEGRFDLDGIGTLIKNNDGKILFKTLEDVNYLIDSYGLSKLKLPKDKVDQEIYKAEEDIQQAVTHQGSFKPLYYLAAFMTFVAIILILVGKYDLIDKVKSISVQDNLNESSSSKKIVFGTRRMLTPDTINGAIGRDINESTLKKNALLYKEKTIVNDENNDSDKQNAYYKQFKEFHIIVGSFIKKDNALNQISKLRDKGYEPTLQKTEDGFYRVVLNTFTDRNLALQELKKFREGLGNSVWILCI